MKGALAAPMARLVSLRPSPLRLTRHLSSQPSLRLARCFSTQPSIAPVDNSVTPAEIRASADRMLDYYCALQRPDGGLDGLDDASHYCKLPNALVWGGRPAQADAMLDFCVSRFLRPNGDFTNEPAPSHYAPAQKSLHWEFNDFYAYLNQWWITAGVRLSRNDFVGRAFEYVDRHWYNAATHAGILQEPLDMRYENCIFTSAHLGTRLLETTRDTHARAHTHTHTHARAHTRTHTHTHYS